ncbi:MAG: hypothetical protein ACO1RA_04445 [Planctomycetaceae bacterium]
MEFNRNQFFMAGLVILLLGIQLRYVDTFVLNEKTTQFIAQKMQDAQLASSDAGVAIAAAVPIAKKAVKPPRWLGYSLLSVGSVLILHSLSLKKPGV